MPKSKTRTAEQDATALLKADHKRIRVLLGELEEACEMFERLLTLRNDLGLLSEEYDPQRERLVGNFPQAFSHIGLVNTALQLDKALAENGR